MTAFRPLLTTLLSALTFASGCASASVGRDASTPPGAAIYLTTVQEGIDRTRRQMPTVMESADVAARRIISSGGRLFVAGSQPEFATEMIARTGGLAGATSPPSLVPQLSRSDVVLYAACGGLKVADAARIARWRDEGLFVIAFASDALSPNPHFRPDVLIDCGSSEGLLVGERKIVPADSVINLINAWTWTGEFFAACTRRGRTPIIHQSPETPGGKLRTARYLGQSFHNDLTVAPIERGVLGNAFLDQVHQSMRDLSIATSGRLDYAGLWLHKARASFDTAALLTGPLYPDHFRDERAPQPFSRLMPLSRTASPAARFVAIIGSERAPQMQIESARQKRHQLFYSTVERGDDDLAANIVYLDPRWPSGEACLRVRGYDVPVLPASSILQAAIYWSLIAEAERVAWLERAASR